MSRRPSSAPPPRPRSLPTGGFPGIRGGNGRIWTRALAPGDQPPDAKHRPRQAGGGDQQQVGRTQGDGQSGGQSGTGQRSGGAAGRNEAEQTLGLGVVEQIGHETPEHRNDEQVEHTGPDKKGARHPDPGQSGSEQPEEEQQVGDEEEVDQREKLFAGIARSHPAEQGNGGQHRQKGAGKQPLQMLDAAGDPHFVTHRPQDVVGAQQGEKVTERPEQRPDFLRLHLDQPFQPDVDPRGSGFGEFIHGETRLAPFMRRLLTGYAIYFNLRHKRSGHLFQNRYKSFVCEEDAYQLELVRYLHLNPLRAGLVEDLSALDSYTWSGHSVIMGESVMEGQDADMVLSLFSKNKNEARRHYRQFVADGIPLGKREEFGSGRKMTKKLLEELGEESYDQRVLGGCEFIGGLRMRRELEAELARPVEIKKIVVKVCRSFDVDPKELLLKSRGERIVAARSVICYLAVRQIGHNGVEVGSHVNLTRAGVSVAATRGEGIVRENQELLALIDK
jgi:putative transposase